MDHSITPLGPAESIPVFNCEVFIGPSPDDASKTRARVANLAGLEVTADSELAALKAIVPKFKEQVASLKQQQQPIPWLEPKLTAEPGEQTRLIAVHL